MAQVLGPARLELMQLSRKLINVKKSGLLHPKVEVVKRNDMMRERTQYLERGENLES